MKITDGDLFESISKFVPVIDQKMMIPGSIFLVGWEDISPFVKDYMKNYDENQQTSLDCISFSCIMILRLLHLIQDESTVMVNQKLFSWINNKPKKENGKD